MSIFKHVVVTLGITGLVGTFLFAGVSPRSVSDGQPSGSLVSGVAVAPPGGSAVLMTAGGTGFTVLTQLCFTPNTDNWCVWANIAGSSLGRIHATDCAAVFEPGGNCIQFHPGVLLPAGEELSCNETLGSGSVTCIASGIVASRLWSR